MPSGTAGTTIVAVSAQLFRTTTKLAVDPDGHEHPGAERAVTRALLTLTDSEGNQGRSLADPAHIGRDVLDGHVRPVLLGRDVLHRARLWQDLARRQRGSAGTLGNRTLAAVELALWDLTGRRLGLPVWQLLGGMRDKVPAYASTMCGDEIPGGLSSPEDYAAFAEKLVAQGHHAVKLHTWMPPVSFAPSVAMDIRACAAVREAVGPDVPLMLDANHWYSRAEALELGRALDRLGFHWFEEPMDEYSVSSYRWLAGQLDTLVIGPETVEGRLQARAEWIAAQACDILRVGVPTSGGIGPALKTAHLAEAFGMDCELHGGGAATLAVLSAVGNARWYERGLLHPFHDFDEVPPHLTRPPAPVDSEGYVHLSHEPGLGEGLDTGYIDAETVASW
ncbi:enolase C-terminal domain-like protein [Streptomyces sp. NRRL F-5123]|uniref:enolase C-terminal domain-like protein n=1 Tax=Streptomyces sp. NRRL F-5123 TaxID=1463856 RepID=UPI0004E0ECD3|nr:enolase C-terminal domain-like protein [Streptomyces sp. NRRL F-5123]